MPTSDQAAGLPIGEALKRTRTRQNIDLGTVEERIKIRSKYLRALENEEWETLPGPAYAKGFLRTYAAFLGLDGDVLVDEYRRTVESSLGAGAPPTLAEPVLEGRLRAGEEPSGRSRILVPILLALGAAVLVVVLVLGLSGGSSDERGRGNGKGHHHASHQQGPSSSQPISLALVTQEDVQVCLVPGHGQPLIDAQPLSAGAKQGPYPPADNYRLDLYSGGSVTVVLDGTPHALHPRQAASFAIDSNGIKPLSFHGQSCK